MMLMMFAAILVNQVLQYYLLKGHYARLIGYTSIVYMCGCVILNWVYGERLALICIMPVTLLFSSYMLFFVMKRNVETGTKETSSMSNV